MVRKVQVRVEVTIHVTVMERIVEVVSIILNNVMVINTRHVVLVHGQRQRHVHHPRMGLTPAIQ